MGRESMARNSHNLLRHLTIACLICSLGSVSCDDTANVTKIITRKRFQIAIVNSQFWHLEVVAGLVHVVSELADIAAITVFLHPQNFPGKGFSYGFIKWMKPYQGGRHAVGN